MQRCQRAATQATEMARGGVSPAGFLRKVRGDVTVIRLLGSCAARKPRGESSLTIRRQRCRISVLPRPFNPSASW